MHQFRSAFPTFHTLVTKPRQVRGGIISPFLGTGKWERNPGPGSGIKCNMLKYRSILKVAKTFIRA